MPQGRPHRALVVNTYSIGNWGDTAIAEGLIDALREAGFDDIAIAASDWRDRPTGRTEAEPDRIVQPLVDLLDIPPIVRRLKPVALAWVAAKIGWATLRPPQAYRAADLVVSVGGGFLGGNKAGANLVKVANIRTGVAAGRRTIVGPVSVSPCSTNVSRVLRWGLRDVVVYAREQQSLDRLQALGIEGRLLPDTAFRAPSLVAAAERAARAPAILSGAIIGWSPRSYRRDHFAWGDPRHAEDVILEAVRRLMAESDVTLRFIPHVRTAHGDDDQAAVSRLVDRLGAHGSRIEVAAAPLSLDAATRLFADLDLLLTSRMHAAIFAMAVGTPALAVAYEPKVRGVMALAGLDDRVLDPTPELAVDDVIQRLEANRGSDARARTRSAFALMRRRLDALPQILDGGSAW